LVVLARWPSPGRCKRRLAAGLGPGGTVLAARIQTRLLRHTVAVARAASPELGFDLVLAVSETGRFKSIAELLAFARANPGKLNVGTPQIGTTQNLAAELFASTAGLSIQIVPFNGTPPVINALRGGEIDAMVDILGPLMPQVQSKALRPLALMGDKRFPALPDVPLLRETGGHLANFNVASWNGLAVPVKTPREVVLKLNREIQTILNAPDVKKRLSDLNVIAQGSTPEGAAEILNADIRRWAEVIARAKIEKQ
jgi:tripartite-type tricarboxylate transporter receptor subunit TctC